MIMGPFGAATRRFGVSRRWLFALFGAAISVAVVALTLFTNGLLSRGDAREAVELKKRNKELRAAIATLEGALPELRDHVTRAEITFAQAWSKSGLGREPQLLGIGPLEAPESYDDAAEITDIESPVRNAALATLPNELERIGDDSAALQATLGDLLEYCRDAEKLLSNTPSIRPTTSSYVTSSFGKRRDPIFGVWLMHKGIDLGGYTGKEIFAPADGVVIFTGRRGGYGKTVVLDHGFGIQTHFAHLTAYEVKPGAKVKRGELIARMGSTGKSTGTHLHYEVRRNGDPIDPRHFILD